MTRQLTAIDLFCGCGGLTQGLKDGGFRVVWAVDLDPLAIATYTTNHPEVTVRTADIRSVDPVSAVQAAGVAPGQLDLVAGCPPCQGFSAMRTLNGRHSVEDARNDLLFEFLRFVTALQPKAIMMENVPGLAPNERFARFTEQLASLGYCGQARVLDAADYGVPQRRRRLIYLAGQGCAIPFAGPSPTKRTVRDAIGAMPPPGESGDPLHDLTERHGERIRKLIALIPKNGGSRTDLPDEMQLACHKRCDGFRDVYGRMAWGEQSPTITGGCFNPSKGRFLHPEQDRAISLREAALLQGFPPGYRFVQAGGKSGVALLIGNALPPPFIAAHARAVSSVIDPV